MTQPIVSIPQADGDVRGAAITWDVVPATTPTGYAIRHQETQREHEVPAWVIDFRAPHLTAEEAAGHYALYLSFIDPTGELEMVDVVQELRAKAALEGGA